MSCSFLMDNDAASAELRHVVRSFSNWEAFSDDVRFNCSNSACNSSFFNSNLFINVDIREPSANILLRCSSSEIELDALLINDDIRLDIC